MEYEAEESQASRGVNQLSSSGDKQEGKPTTKKEVKGNQTRGVRDSLLL